MLPIHDSLPQAVKARNQAMNYLLETYPNAFDLRNRRPLKATILDDILTQGLPADISKAAIEQAYQHYTHWGSYLSAMTAGAACFDLSGQRCGEVSASQAKEAEQLIEQAQSKGAT